MTTLHALTNPVSKSLLPCGVEVTYHKLLNKDYQPCLQQYGYFIEAMSITMGVTEPTVEDVRRFMPAVLMEVYNAFIGVGKVAIESFFAIFSDDLTPEIIAGFDFSDYEKMWQLIYEDNKTPFEMRLRLMVSGGALKTAIERYNTATETMNSSTSLSEQELTPETEALQSNTPGQLLSNNSNMKTGKQQKKDTTPD